MSILAGNPATGQSAISRIRSYGAARTSAVNSRLTWRRCHRPLSDRRGAARLEDFHGLDGHSTFPNIVFEKESYNALSAAIGMKGNLFGRLLLDVNLLFKLDENGLRDKVTPLIGLEYSF